LAKRRKCVVVHPLLQIGVPELLIGEVGVRIELDRFTQCDDRVVWAACVHVHAPEQIPNVRRQRVEGSRRVQLGDSLVEPPLVLQAHGKE